jgi:adenylate cyclase
VAERSGLDYEYARRVWRALGMPEVDPDTPYFDEVDVATLASLKQLIDAGVDREAIIVNARVYGQAYARIAEVDARLFHQIYAADDQVTLEAAVPALLRATQLQRQDSLRRHATLAVRDIVLSDGAGATSAQAVGFVDLVDFTQLSMDLHGEDLGRLIGRFEEIAIESCANAGSRLVKMIGDAVMFVAADPVRVLATARGAVAAVRDDATLFEARAGLDFGPVLASGGDYFGTPVNTASRITGFARSGTVVASEAFVEALEAGQTPVRDLGRQTLRGVGPVRLYKLRQEPPPGTEPVEGEGAASRTTVKAVRAARKRERKQA